MLFSLAMAINKIKIMDNFPDSGIKWSISPAGCCILHVNKDGTLFVAGMPSLFISFQKSIVSCNNKPSLTTPLFQPIPLKKTKQNLHAETQREGIRLFTLIQFTAAIPATGRAKIEPSEAIE